ncbi:M23 family metallopeptidase [Patescibacteria group bacterium]|nr:M23 family metallopeptidase [Patescibacteria group bacterium]MBU1703576.1 M23 family metallopeptidase [Patescibacteria group bacterium]MBU1954345.1 M23 family metallopeptidase [Patescibacteria group bacterium]
MFAQASVFSLSRLGSIFGGTANGDLAAKARKAGRLLTPYFHVNKPESFDSAHSASNKLFKRYTATVALLFVIGSISPMQMTDSAYADEYAEYYTDTSLFETGILSDDDGYLTKLNPQTNQGDRSGMSDSFLHTVESGESLSMIANSYGLKTDTVLWANGMANANSIRTGQKLIIPPVDGISYEVSKGDTIEKIAKKYSVEADAIKKQNGLLADTVAVGDKIYVPGAKPLVDPTRITPARASTSSRAVAVGTAIPMADSNTIPAGDRPFIFPTRGSISQGFHPGHYAIDIADVSKPPIWAAASGKVVKASSGTWGGGYGNHVIIDHGNGLQTLYAHLDYLTVNEGDVVDQGQVIGRMGRTGRVYGRTGIHLHFEVIKNGVKQVPSNYY